MDSESTGRWKRPTEGRPGRGVHCQFHEPHWDTDRTRQTRRYTHTGKDLVERAATGDGDSAPDPWDAAGGTRGTDRRSLTSDGPEGTDAGALVRGTTPAHGARARPTGPGAGSGNLSPWDEVPTPAPRNRTPPPGPTSPHPFLHRVLHPIPHTVLRAYFPCRGSVAGHDRFRGESEDSEEKEQRNSGRDRRSRTPPILEDGPRTGTAQATAGESRPTPGTRYRPVR